MPTGNCRFCATPLRHTFVDLGMSPLANSYLTLNQLQDMEPFYPLHVYVCEECLLVQLEECQSPAAIFSDYAYFSSFSDSWLQHAKSYVEMATERFALGPHSQVIEIASNDGYLLQYFVEKQIPVLGIEPAENVAQAAIQKGIQTQVAFFGQDTAIQLVESGTRADVLIGNNVLAHVPQLNDFVAGIKVLLSPHGVATFEFPHLMQLMAENQFDTIYHEHFSYFSFSVVQKIFAAHGLQLFDVEELSTHGGSLRIYAAHDTDTTHPIGERVGALLAKEEAAGFTQLRHYLAFDEQVQSVKHQMLDFLIDAKRQGKTVVGYGAPAKGNTLLNYCGVRADLIDYTVDRSPHKQDHFLPGTRIPIYGPERIQETKPDYVLILPWNLKDEIVAQIAAIRDWGGQFIVPIPELQVCA